MKSFSSILIALLVFSLTPQAQAKRAPNLEFKDRSGTTRKVADLRGSIVVLNFWATWCGPCLEEMPSLFVSSLSPPTMPKTATRSTSF